MSRNGSGTYSLPAGQPVVTGTSISSTTFNTLTSDLATALTQSIAYDGQTTPVANLPMGGFKLTGLGAGTALTDAAQLAQVQSSAVQLLSGVSGVDTITAGITPTPAAYAAGQTFRFVSAGANTTAVTLNISSLGAKAVTKNGSTALVAGDIPSGAICEVTYDGTRFQLIDVPVTATNLEGKIQANLLQGFRLSLTTATPITTSDVIGGTTIYAVPYEGNVIGLYDGSRWNVRTSAEFSLGLGTLTSGKPYDVFCYDNAGVPTLEFLVWTNDTTRATALAYQDGVLVKSGAATRRYMGTFYTTSTTQTEDSVSKRYLWNYYHRATRSFSVVEGTNTWNYTTATWHQVNASAANQCSILIGVVEDQIDVYAQGFCVNSTGNLVAVGIGIDSTSVNSAQIVGARTAVASTGANPSATYLGYPLLGQQDIVWLEISEAGGTTTWYGDGGVTYISTGMIGRVLA